MDVRVYIELILVARYEDEFLTTTKYRSKREIQLQNPNVLEFKSHRKERSDVNVWGKELKENVLAREQERSEG